MGLAFSRRTIHIKHRCSMARSGISKVLFLYYNFCCSYIYTCLFIFNRGGPASDLRSSGILGLHCLLYFVKNYSETFNKILNRIRHGVSEGNMKNYPLAIACINVVATLVEMFGFGDAGSHSDGCSNFAPKTFVLFVANEVEKRGDIFRQSMYGSIGQYTSWDDIADDSINTVFEDMFCILFPILDRLFVEMGAVSCFRMSI